MPRVRHVSSRARSLGIPTVLDRVIQQAVMQALQRSWDGTFSEHSYGFRPKRSALAHPAVRLRDFPLVLPVVACRFH
jgi:retron-type reverse transcriptase